MPLPTPSLCSATRQAYCSQGQSGHCCRWHSRRPVNREHSQRQILSNLMVFIIYFQGSLNTCNFFFFNLIGRDQCCHLLCSTWRMLNRTQIKDQGPGNFVACEFILGKKVQPRFSFCLSPELQGGGCSQSF